MTDSTTILLGVAAAAGVLFLALSGDDEPPIQVMQQEKKLTYVAEDMFNIPVNPMTPGEDWPAMDYTEPGQRQLDYYEDPDQTEAQKLLAREIETIRGDLNPYKRVNNNFLAVVDRITNAMRELKQIYQDARDDPNYDTYKEVQKGVDVFENQYYLGKSVYVGMREYCTQLVMDLDENQDISPWPEDFPIDVYARKELRRDLVALVEEIAKSEGKTNSWLQYIKDGVEEYQMRPDPTDQEYQMSDSEEENLNYGESSTVEPPRTPPRIPENDPREQFTQMKPLEINLTQQPEGLETFTKSQTETFSEVSSVDLGEMEPHRLNFNSYKPNNRVAPEIRSSPSGRKYKAFIKDATPEERKKILSREAIYTPPPMLRPERPPTQVGLSTKKGLDAFRIQMKSTKSQIEAALGDENRVKLQELSEEVHTMVPAGYTDSSWYETLTERRDLFTENEKGEPGARIRWEELKDDPVFQDYTLLQKRLDEALEKLNIPVSMSL